MDTTKLYKTIIFIISLSLVILAISSNLYAEDEPDEVGEALEEELAAEPTDVTESSSVWELVGHAGNIQYPIFGILIIGLFLISLRSYELYMDSQLESDLRETSFANMSLEQINTKISSQSDFMLSRIMAKILNVFQTNKNADYLHDEISNYNDIQKDNFNSFKNRIDFLSDTAGALGLLGTVWGMFIVFSSGALEQEVILAGMGIALMSTLLGLVVSIILNFCSTITEGYFSKHLEKVTSKADELRFRLIELSESQGTEYKEVAPPVNNNDTAKFKQVQVDTNQNDKPKAAEKSKQTHTSAEKSAQETRKAAEPAMLVAVSDINKVSAGETLDNFQTKLLDTSENPVEAAKLEIMPDGESRVNGKTNKSVIQTDKNGVAKFKWDVGKAAGTKKVLVKYPDSTTKKIEKEVSVDVTAGEPASIKLLTNHQAASIETKLDKPIIAIVNDEFGNPVNKQPVQMRVTMGNGKLKNGVTELEAQTDNDGKVYIDFELGSTPGFNAVEVKIPEYELLETFQAVGQEVTA